MTCLLMIETVHVHAQIQNGTEMILNIELQQLRLDELGMILYMYMPGLAGLKQSGEPHLFYS